MTELEEEIQNLGTLVDAAAKRLEAEIKAGDSKALKELLWQVPTAILADYVKEEGTHDDKR